MKTSEYSFTYGKWRKKIIRANGCFALTVFAIEIAMYFLLKRQNLILQPEGEYLIRFLLLPSVCNFLIIFVGIWLNHKVKIHRDIINYIPIVQMLLICMTVAGTHYAFPETLGTFCFPIFVTVVFSDERMVQKVTGLSLLLLLLALCARYFAPEKGADPYLIPEGVVAVVIIGSSNLICRILTGVQKEKDNIIVKSYHRQICLQEQLDRDHKTGLYDADAFSRMLNEQVEMPDNRPLILAVIDVDNFKKINDTYGHANGDEVLHRLAELLLKGEVEGFFPARFGGEEFTVIFRSDLLTARRWLEELRIRFARQKYGFMSERVTVSIGLAVWEPEETEQEFFSNADAAMYHSKRQGKNRVSLFARHLKAETGS